MTATPAPVPATPPDDRAQAVHDQQLAILDRLSEVSLVLLDVIEVQAQALKAEEGTPALRATERLTRAYANLGRAIRLTMMLRNRLTAEARDRHRNDGGPPGGAATRRHENLASEHILSLARDLVRDEPDGLTRESFERLDSEHLEEVLSRPFDEAVQVICEDLGLDPEWPRWATQAWDKAKRSGEPPGWPLASIPLPGSRTAAPPRLGAPP